MTDRIKNPNAFPGKEESAFGQDTGHYYGMTLRDYFAAKVITGAFQNASAGSQSELAKRAYEIADAMLNQREQ
jgi:hypothetical protein